MTGDRSVDDARRALGDLTRRWPWSGDRRRRLFVGSIEGDNGRLWFSRLSGFSSAARSLRFRIEPVGTGCRVVGELGIVLPLGIWLGLSLVAFACLEIQFFYGAIRWGGLSGSFVLREAGRMVAALLMSYGYCWVAVWFGGRAEALGLKVMKYVIADARAEGITLDLLGIDR